MEVFEEMDELLHEEFYRNNFKTHLQFLDFLNIYTLVKNSKKEKLVIMYFATMCNLTFRFWQCNCFISSKRLDTLKK